MNTPLRSIFRDAARAIRNNKHEVVGDGRIHVPSGGFFIGGFFRTRYAPPGEDFGPAQITHINPNRFVTQGLIKLVNLLGGHASSAALYIAPFSGNVTPQADWTGANFTANATEFTSYSGANRVPWTTVAATSSAELINTAAVAAATITLSAGGPYTIRGAGLIEGQAKSAITGSLYVASRFDADMTGLAAGGKIGFEYGVSAVDESDA
jgi:hypothetical protein